LKRFLDRLGRWATGRTLLLLFAAYIVLGAFGFRAAYAPIEATGTTPFDVLFSFTPDQAYSRLETYGEPVRRHYALVEVTIDLAFPVVNALLFSCLALFLFQRGGAPPGAIRYLALIPFGTMTADLLENVGIVTMLLSYPSRLDAVARITSLFVSLKWVFIGASALVVLIAAVGAVKRRLTRA
jgi:hypothetical protein